MNNQAIEKKSSDVDVKIGSTIDVWAKTDKIREIFAPNLSQTEFMAFVGLGKSIGANPFTREIWAVKYDKSAPAAIFCGRDFYRKKAQEQRDYNGHMVEAVYSKDEFRMNVREGVPEHSYNMADRGQLIGAYGIAWKKGVDHPVYVFVKLSEYDKGFSLWKSMKETLIKKVAEAQVLRMGWQGIFAGTYSEDEQPIIEASYHETDKAAIIAPRQKISESPVDQQTGEVLTLSREPIDSAPAEAEQ
jgi:phage recombination protein Bet